MDKLRLKTFGWNLAAAFIGALLAGLVLFVLYKQFTRPAYPPPPARPKPKPKAKPKPEPIPEPDDDDEQDELYDDEDELDRVVFMKYEDVVTEKA